MICGLSDNRNLKQFQPCEKWKQIIQNCQELNTQFIDDSFPPNSTSIDGRKIHHHVNSSSNSSNSNSGQSNHRMNTLSVASDAPRVIQCKCGLPASIRTVQKDGPNYGRFYLSCGSKIKYAKTRKNTKRKRDNEEKDDTTSNDKIIIIDSGDEKENNENSSSSQQQSINVQDVTVDTLKKPLQCSFFQWDDNHLQTTSSSSSSSRSIWLNNLPWFRYDTNDGCFLTYPKGNFAPDHVKQGRMGDCWFLSALVRSYF